ncbi:MAG: hypothetical protein ACYC35_01110 [Pirellulales bacterium]
MLASLMPSTDTIAMLNRLLVLLSRSLLTYLADTTPWTPPGGPSDARDALAVLAGEKRTLAYRIGELIVARGGRIDPGGFPMAFSDTHDLAIDYLLTMMIRDQKQDLDAVEEIAGRLDDDPEAKALAQETLGSTRAHLKRLEEMAAKHG